MRCREVFGDINDNRPRPTGGGYIECFRHDRSYILDTFDHKIMLDAWPRAANRVDFLKRIGTNVLGSHLPRNHNQRY